MKKKALVIRFSSIGDIVLTTPVIRHLSESGDYEVYLLTHLKYVHVLASNPYLQEIHGHEGSLFETKKWITDNHFDVIIDLHCSIRSHLLSFLLLRKFYGFEKLRIKRWLRTKLKRRLKPDIHISKRFLNSLIPLDIKTTSKGLDFSISDQNRIELDISNQERKFKIALITGARHFTKTVPNEISEKIIKSFPQIDFHLLGGKFEVEKTKPLNEFVNVTNHCGHFNLEQSADIMRQCDVVITTDTALMHIASALGKNIISIWGGTVPEFGFTPLTSERGGKNTFIEINNMTCRPCSKSGRGSCPLGHFNCMNKISTNSIESAIKEYLGANHFQQNDV